MTAMGSIMLIVLDKSAIVAAPWRVLLDLRQQFRFLTTDMLLHEIATEGLQEVKTLTMSDMTRLTNRIALTLAKAKEVSDSWFERYHALTWEIVQGESSRQAPQLQIPRVTVEEMLQLVHSEPEELLRQDEAMAQLSAFVHAPEDEETFRKLRRLTRSQMLDFLDEHFANPQTHSICAREALVEFSALWRTLGHSISPRFLPDRSWLTYGIALTNRAFLVWKFCRFGDAAADSKKPENAIYDNFYVAAMACADGILSADTNLLELAWVCWPEKRDAILQFNQQSKTPEQFRPT